MATFEIVGGLLLISGSLTRLVSIPFIFQMTVAVLTTKIALYLGTSPLPLPPALPQVGAWAVLHEIRSDYAQIMSCLFLAISGPGPLSLDAWLSKRREEWEPRAEMLLASGDVLSLSRAFRKAS